MSLFHKISPGSTHELLNVIVEIPKGSRNKYELDKETGAIMLDRVLHSPFFYPVDYGFAPQTWYDDGDPIDVMVHLREPTFPGCVIETRVIGVLRMKDEKGTDDKILAVPTGDPFFDDVKDITDLNSAFLNEVSHFFERYKDLEKNKFVEVVGWMGRDEAIKAVAHAKELYLKKFGKK